MITFLITIMACICGYALVGGAAGARVQTVGTRKCRNYKHDSDCGHWWLAGGTIILWPVLVPLMAGYVLGKNDKTERARSQADLELEQAKRNRLLEQEHLREAQAIVERLRICGNADA